MAGMRDIRITPVCRGWIVNAGCTTVVYTDMNAMLKDIKAYSEAKDQSVFEKEFIQKNHKGMNPAEPPPCNPVPSAQCEPPRNMTGRDR